MTRDARLRHRLAWLVLAGVAVLGGAACSWQYVPPVAAPAVPVPPEQGTPVLLVGDSLLTQTCDGRSPEVFYHCTRWESWSGALAAHRFGTVAVDAECGRTVSGGQRLLGSLGSDLPAVIVVVLGTNDLLGDHLVDGVQGPAERLASLVEAVVAEAGPDRQVLWLTPQLDWSTQSADIGGRAAELLNELDGASRTLRVADWHAHSAGHRDWFAIDGVHFTAAGAAAFRAFVSEALGTWYRQGWT